MINALRTFLPLTLAKSLGMSEVHRLTISIFQEKIDVEKKKGEIRCRWRESSEIPNRIWCYTCEYERVRKEVVRCWRR